LVQRIETEIFSSYSTPINTDVVFMLSLKTSCRF
jgi:hypothetical protein